MRDLAGHLRQPDRLVWMDLQMGPHGSPRPDVFTLQKSYVRPIPSAYECKVSVSDFRSDVTSGKWQSYLTLASAVTFCVPKGLVTKEDIPVGCGLMTRSDDSWATIRKATRQAVALSTEHLLKLLIDGFSNELGAVELRERGYREAKAHNKLCKKFGDEVALVVRDLQSAKRMIDHYQERGRQKIESAEKEAESIRSTAREDGNEVRELLGLALTASRWDVDRAIRDLRSLKRGDDQETERLLAALRSIRTTCESTLRSLQESVA